jgi:cell division control protein 11
LGKIRRKKNVKKGIQFCLMVCGASGTGNASSTLPTLVLRSQADHPILAAGRTTFVNTLCGKKVLHHKDSDDPTTAHIEEGVKIKPITVGRADNHDST